MARKCIFALDEHVPDGSTCPDVQSSGSWEVAIGFLFLAAPSSVDACLDALLPSSHRSVFLHGAPIAARSPMMEIPEVPSVWRR